MTEIAFSGRRKNWSVGSAPGHGLSPDKRNEIRFVLLLEILVAQDRVTTSRVVESAVETLPSIVLVVRQTSRGDTLLRTCLRFARRKFPRPFGVCATANHTICRRDSPEVARALSLCDRENVRPTN